MSNAEGRYLGRVRAYDGPERRTGEVAGCACDGCENERVKARASLAREAAADLTLKSDASNAVAALSDDERLELFSNYCRGCGRPVDAGEKCYCWNDD